MYLFYILPLSILLPLKLSNAIAHDIHIKYITYILNSFIACKMLITDFELKEDILILFVICANVIHLVRFSWCHIAFAGNASYAMFFL